MRLQLEIRIWGGGGGKDNHKKQCCQIDDLHMWAEGIGMYQHPQEEEQYYTSRSKKKIKKKQHWSRRL